MMKNLSRVSLGIVVAILAGIFFSFDFLSSTYLDYLYFVSQNASSVWWKFIYFRAGFYVTGFFVAWLSYLVAYYYARVLLRDFFKGGMPPGAAAILIAVGAVAAFILHAPALKSLWGDMIYFLYAPDMGVSDPIYQKDASFYMFELPIYSGLLGWVRSLLFFLGVYSAVPFFIAFFRVDYQNDRGAVLRILGLGARQIAVIGGLFFATFAAGSMIAGYTMLYQGSSDVVAGASYTDVNARQIAYTVFFFIGILVSIGIIVSGFIGKWFWPAVGAGVWVGLYLLVLQVYPSIIQTWVVNPNEYAAEKEYIKHSIDFTRIAYGLDKPQQRDFEVSGRLDAEDLKASGNVIDNIRLWDYRPIRDTFKQLQEIRLYYEFNDVDIDRYMIDGKMRQVMLSARELDSEELPQQAQAWIPRHLQYTHGYGIVAAPANRVTEEGLPELWVRDFPPQRAVKDFPELKDPVIYYGEKTNDYALVKTGIKEFDYPDEDSFAETTYDGDGGVELGSFLRRLLIAWNFDTWKMLVSQYLTPESRILFHRNIHRAVRKIAPFLVYDPDPYIVVGDDGALYWIMDAYTTSSRFPYSEKFDYGFLRQFEGGRQYGSQWELHGINYIRNSVKVVINAKTGKMDYYLVDEKDPVARTWASFFPKLFKDQKNMPDFIRRHLRYPETIFLVQSGMLRDYHMEETRTFYNREDRWQISSEIYSGNQQKVEPYYTVMRLPGEKEDRYVLMIPFIPNNKQNIVAWMAADCDYTKSHESADEGRIFLFEFPRTKQVYGTMQIESRIDQNPEISQDLTLWNQQGSRVIRGNLLVIPVNDTLLYIEPIYLQATKSPFPELRRVIAADANAIVMEPTLEQAMSRLTGVRISRSSERATTIDGKVPEQSSYDPSGAVQLLKRARDAAGRGDWEKFGQEMQRLEEYLSSMNRGQ